MVVCGAAADVAGLIRETVTDCHRLYLGGNIMNYTNFAGKAMLSQPMAGKTDEEIITTLRDVLAASSRDRGSPISFWR